MLERFLLSVLFKIHHPFNGKANTFFILKELKLKKESGTILFLARSNENVPCLGLGECGGAGITVCHVGESFTGNSFLAYHNPLKLSWIGNMQSILLNV